ncbi:MAG: hypothetical protein M0Z91_00885 [Actinomycetota bacterium]|nr:hypothetical protein [Actinomycetota bacterium]
MRIWLEDRPGALGAVASRIGSVRGDLVGIEILERGGGRAVDEIVVEMPDPELLQLLVREVHEVDGVEVESVRELDTPRDVRLDPLEISLRMLDRESPESVAEVLSEQMREMFEFTFAAVVDADGEAIVAAAGDSPEPAWLAAFARGGALLNGNTASAGSDEEMVVFGLGYRNWSFVAARHELSYRALERSQAFMLCSIAGRYCNVLAGLSPSSARR